MATKYYAVKVGRTTGIFETWDQCKASVNGYRVLYTRALKLKLKLTTIWVGTENKWIFSI